MVFNLNRIYVGILILFVVLFFYFSKLDLVFFFLIYIVAFFEILKNKIINLKFTIIFSLIGFFLILISYLYNLNKIIFCLSIICYFLVFLQLTTKKIFFVIVVLIFFINSFSIIDNSRDLFYFIIFISFFNDSIAYVFGNLIRGPKITPVISPNKTWSGTIISVILSSVLIYFYLNSYIFISIIMSLSLFFGDLFFSYIKRSLKLKDFSKFLKSHGGILDRLDSMIFLPLIININIFFT